MANVKQPLLTKYEIDSSAWIKVKRELESSLERIRSDLEKASNTELQTAVLRGRAKQIRLILSLGVSSSTDSAGDD